MTNGAGARVSLNEAGLGLVELMVVLVFIAIGIMALSGVQTHSLTDVYSTGRHTRALDLAQRQMETARGAGYTLAQSDSGVADGFNWLCQVDSTNAGLSAGFKRVTTTVSWTNAGAPRSVRLVNLLSAR